MILRLAPAALIALTAACATPTEAESRQRGVVQFDGDPRLGEEVRRVCFASSIDSFSNPTRETVIIDLSPTRSYLVETFGSCFDLDNAQSIGLAARTGCLSKGDTLIASDSAFGLRNSSGFGPSRCVVKALYDWDPKANENMKGDAETEDHPA